MRVPWVVAIAFAAVVMLLCVGILLVAGPDALLAIPPLLVALAVFLRAFAVIVSVSPTSGDAEPLRDEPSGLPLPGIDADK